MIGRRLRWAGVIGAATVVVAAAAFVGFRLLGPPSVPAAASGPVVPSARVTRGAMTLTVHLRGDLRAAKQASLTAPAVGGQIRILSMVETGTPVVADDVLMEFDPADQQFALEQAESELLEAEQEIIKRRAEIAAQEAQDKVALLTAQFDVRRAELDAAVDEDLIAATTFKIRQAELQEARGNLERLKQDVAVRSAQGKASLSVLQEKKARSEMTAARARQNMQNLVLRAPMAGVVSVRENMDAGGGMFYEGMSLPAFRVGDTVYSGRPVLDVFDVETLEVRARVNEQERANVAVGQTARLEADAAPDLATEARVTQVAGLGRPDNRAGPLRQFDVVLELVHPDPRLRPGTTVRVVVTGDTVKDVLLVPRSALFEIDGKPVVYERAGGAEAFAPRSIKVLHRTESQVAIEGVEEGAHVALVNPVAALKLSSDTSSSSGGPMGVRK